MQIFVSITVLAKVDPVASLWMLAKYFKDKVHHPEICIFGLPQKTKEVKFLIQKISVKKSQ